MMCLIIYQDMTDMARRSIDLKINLRPTSEVPFPAITITLSDALDPMKVAKQSGNLISRDLLPQQGLSYRFEADVFMLCVITFTEFNTLLHAAFYKAMAACQGEMAETLLNQTSSIAGQKSSNASKFAIATLFDRDSVKCSLKSQNVDIYYFKLVEIIHDIYEDYPEFLQPFMYKILESSWELGIHSWR